MASTGWTLAGLPADCRLACALAAAAACCCAEFEAVCAFCAICDGVEAAGRKKCDQIRKTAMARAKKIAARVCSERFTVVAPLRAHLRPTMSLLLRHAWGDETRNPEQLQRRNPQPASKARGRLRQNQFR